MSFLVGLQIRLVQIMCKIGIIPVPIRRIKSSDLDELITNGNFQNIDTEKIYKGASSYFVVAKKMPNEKIRSITMCMMFIFRKSWQPYIHDTLPFI